MKYFEISIKTTHEASELVCDLAYNYTDEGVSVKDYNDVIELEKAGKTWDYAEDGVFCRRPYRQCAPATPTEFQCPPLCLCRWVHSVL